MRQGEVITAEVVLIDHNFVVVNAGLKSESYVPLEEFLNDQGEIEVKVGDFVQVAIEMLEDGYGATRLSRDRAKRIAAWNALEQALNDGSLVTGTHLRAEGEVASKVCFSLLRAIGASVQAFGVNEARASTGLSGFEV